MIENSSYINHWDEKFSSREWGKYPPEDLVRFIGRNFKNKERSDIKVLEVGCGPGANLWFINREGFKTYGIDGSPTAVKQALTRITSENQGLKKTSPEIIAGNFESLPWQDAQFDVVLDVFAIYANPVSVIRKTLSEVHRVLKPNGLFFSKVWGTGCTGYNSGTEIEKNTFDDIKEGPCANMGLSHFFDIQEIKETFSSFKIVSIDIINRTDHFSKSNVEEYICIFQK